MSAVPDRNANADLLAAMIDHAPCGLTAETRLQAVVRDGVRNPGKLVRGRLVQAVGAVLEVPPSLTVTTATAVEYFHLASLLLDDLPCMDDARLRRGQPCAHVTHGEASAVLGALAFINRAYTLLGFAMAGWPRDIRLQMQGSVDACLGWAGLVGGQARDLAFARSAGGTQGAREVGRIAVQKTSGLLWLSALLPALAGSASSAELRSLHALCLYWGLAFQAVDDLRDVLATSVDAGKTTRRDQRLRRPNLALALGIPATRRRITRLLQNAQRRLSALATLRPGWAQLTHFHPLFEQSAAPLAVAPAREAA